MIARGRCAGPTDGQALIEACLVIALTALCLFGALQLSQVLAGREIMEHAAARGARARTVGFNRGMVARVVDVAAIPNAGRLRVPDFENINAALRRLTAGASVGEIWTYALGTTPESQQARLELARIPDYLGAENEARAHYILDYEDWDRGADGIQYWAREDSATGNGSASASMTHVRTRQNYRLWVPMHRAFYADDRMELEGNAYLEAHFPLYLDDQAW
ncbi:MAG: hypothetical protein K8T26_09655 [Lentisphaerae bacterium]|nr:hypothetical protein [Lentisphaerota bacterium]